MTASWTQIGHTRRLARVLGSTGRTIMVALDDTLIAGPSTVTAGSPSEAAGMACASGADSVLAYPGLFARIAPNPEIGFVVNVTASTTRGRHVEKVRTCDLESALSLGADAVAVHINVSSATESDMLQILGQVCAEAHAVGMPVLGIAYPRREDATGGDDNYTALAREDPEAFSALVIHAARIAVDLGCSIVKTTYPGSLRAMTRLVAACDDVPVLIAGGPSRPSHEFLQLVKEATAGGASGVGVGRNFFQSEDPIGFLHSLRTTLTRGAGSVGTSQGVPNCPIS